MIERLDAYMARANAAYYAAHDPFADFTTAPEISQVFGEILGLWAAVAWEQMGQPRPVVLAEAGPGRGTLLADALRAIAQTAPLFRDALAVHLIETSPRLRAAQAHRLPKATWHEGLETLPKAPLVLLANEFMDALPIRQFVRRAGSWMERYVLSPVDSPGAPAAGPSAIVDRPTPAAPCGREAGEGEVVEVCESALAFASALGERFAARPGAALMLDYGPAETTNGDSLQAIQAGRAADPLAAAGSADLTAHVDFSSVAAAARGGGATTYGPLPQGLFLTRLGLFRRADRLAYGKPAARALPLLDAVRRLVEPDQMGRLFKALALTSPDAPVPAGF